jgi:molecular chaperone DnaK
LIHSTEKSLSDLGDKVPAGEKSAIEAAMADLKKATEGEDADEIKKRLEALAQVSMKLGEAMYKQQGSGDAGGPEGPSAGAGPGAKPGDSGVVDADFEEVKDDKKKSA